MVDTQFTCEFQLSKCKKDQYTCKKDRYICKFQLSKCTKDQTLKEL